jgi:hypothetical protein
MDEFRKHLEYGKRNRVEEALRKGEPLRYSTQTSTPIVEASSKIKNKAPELRKVSGGVIVLKKRQLLMLLVLALVIAGGVYGVPKAYKYYEYRVMLSNIEKEIGLPDEKPNVATVINLEPLKGQEFFKDALVGDKVLIFSRSKKAVLYRPATKKVIAVAPING